MIRDYYVLAKPGIIYGNLLSAVGGFFLAAAPEISAARAHLHDSLMLVTAVGIGLGLLFLLIVGLGLVIGSASVFNNIYDRRIDKNMKRTKNRALVSGRISTSQAAWYGTILGVSGSALLWICFGPFPLLYALAGWVLYVLVYTPLKHVSPHAALVGALVGACPPLVGAVAAARFALPEISTASWVLAGVLLVWQLPHFYAISIFRKAEYEAAGVPVLSAKAGMPFTGRVVLATLFLTVLTSMGFWLTPHPGPWCTLLITGLGLWWLTTALLSFKTTDTPVWARQVFGNSLVYLLGLVVLIVVSSIV